MAASSIAVKWVAAVLGALGVAGLGIWLTRSTPSPARISPSPEAPGVAEEVTSPYRILILEHDPERPTILTVGPLGDGARPVPGPLARDFDNPYSQAAIYPSPDGRRVVKIGRPGGTTEMRLASSPFNTFDLVTNFEDLTFVADVLWAEDLLYVLGAQCPVCESFEKDPPTDSEEGHLRVAEAPPNAYTFFEVNLTTRAQRVVGRAQRRPGGSEVLGAIDRDRRRQYWYLWSTSGSNVVEDSLAYVDLDSARDARAFPIGMIGARPVFRPDGHGFFAVEGESGQFELVEYRLPDGRRRTLVASANGFGEVTLDAVGGSLYAIVDGALASIDLSNGRPETLVDDGGSLQVESLSPDGRFLWLSDIDQAIFLVFDSETQVLHTTDVGYHDFSVVGWVQL